LFLASHETVRKPEFPLFHLYIIAPNADFDDASIVLQAVPDLVEGRPEPLIAKISQETLAEMIGATRSRVSHFMNRFRQSGLIDYNGRLEVHSSLLSVVLADQPRVAKSSL
jgi:hypothetical protein